jgi:hypothetical protein
VLSLESKANAADSEAATEEEATESEVIGRGRRVVRQCGGTRRQSNQVGEGERQPEEFESERQYLDSDEREEESDELEQQDRIPNLNRPGYPSERAFG